MAPAESPSRPLRVLCLHGTCSCGSAMSKQLSRLQPKLKGKCELVFVDGRMAPEADNPMMEEQSRYFKGMQFYDFARWHKWNAEVERAEKFKQSISERFPVFEDMMAHLEAHPEDRVKASPNRTYEDLDAVLKYLQEQLRRNQPIDGILGFSQGSNMANMLVAQGVAGEGPLVSFAIHLCGGRPGWMEQLPHLYEKVPFRVRSLHISGNLDFGNSPLPLLDLYEEPISMMHPDGHRPIPGSSSEAANMVTKAIVDFILGDAMRPFPESPASAPRAATDTREVQVDVYVDRDLDLKYEMTLPVGCTMLDIKRRLAEQDPSGMAKPGDFSLRLPGSDVLGDVSLLTAEMRELDVLS